MPFIYPPYHAAHAVLNSPWSLSIAVLILLLSAELVVIRSSLEPWSGKTHTSIFSRRTVQETVTVNCPKGSATLLLFALYFLLLF